MSEERWEYCVLNLFGRKTITKSKGMFSSETVGDGYSCAIVYVDTEGNDIVQQLGNLEVPSAFNPFVRAMGMLGGMGWELVSVQYGNLEFSLGGFSKEEYRWDTLSHNNRVAYFKRRAVSGRAVNEPKLTL